MSHPIGSRQDTDTAFSFIGSVSQFPLHLNDLLFLDALADGFNEQNIWMKRVINLFAGKAMIAGISPFRFFPKAVECLCKLESHVLLPNPFISQKEVAVHHLFMFDCPLEQ
jgi:hypothetical protein